jgi:hypothetical protein
MMTQMPDGDSARAAAEQVHCGARLRGGGRCDRAPMPGKRRCRSHGGAPGVGAPKGNRNRFVHGLRSGEAVALRKRFNGYLRRFRVSLAGL